MAALRVIEFAGAGDAAKTVDEVEEVEVIEGNRIGAAVESRGGEDGVVKVVDELWMVLEEPLKHSTTVPV